MIINDNIIFIAPFYILFFLLLFKLRINQSTDNSYVSSIIFVSFYNYIKHRYTLLM